MRKSHKLQAHFQLIHYKIKIIVLNAASSMKQYIVDTEHCQLMYHSQKWKFCETKQNL